MKRAVFASPYFWSATAAVVLVALAWSGRERNQAVVAGTVAPALAAVDLDGDTVHLSDYQDSVVLVNVWATTCAPCRSEMPSMQSPYLAFDGTDFAILAVSVDGPGTDLTSFGDELGLTFPLLHDPDGRVLNSYQATGLPESFLVGRDGVIYKRVAGATDWSAPANQALVRRLLAM